MSRSTADHASMPLDPARLEDHLVGLELQIVELVERRERARVQGRDGEAVAIQHDIDGLQLEMAQTADLLARSA